MLPLPLAVNPEAPPLPTAVNVSLVITAGRTSVTVAPVTLLGPLLLTTMVYVVVPPGITEVTPSVLLIARSACGVNVSVSVALLLLRFGSVTPAGAAILAVLVIVPVALPATVALTVKVTLPPAGSVGTTMPAPCISATVVFGAVGHAAPRWRCRR